MSTNSGKNSRQEKHARFETPAKSRPNQTPLIVGGIVAILAAVVIGGGMLFALSQGTGKSGNASAAPANPNPVSTASGVSGASAVSPATVKTRYTAVQAADGTVRLPMTTFDDSKAHFYSFVSGGKSVDLFVIKSSDGTVRTALDACEVCWPAHKGYRQQGDVMICNNCGRQFPSAQIGEVRGGCNPVPLAQTVDGTDLVIRSTDIAAGAGYF
jgi:hypothetical protein